MIGVDAPWGLVGLLAVAGLVALHLLDRRRETLVVSSLRLWRRLPAQPVGLRRWRADLLLALQVATAVALTAALARPWIEWPAVPRASGALAVVVDVSASMGASEPGGTRLALAVRRAVLEAKAGGDVMIVAAGARPEIATRWTGDPDAIREAFAALAVRDVAGNLAPAVDLAVASVATRPAARVLVVTDLAPAESGVGDATAARVDWAQVGRTDDNLALIGARVEAVPFGGSPPTVVAEVANFSARARTTRLAARVGERPWATRPLAIPPRGTVVVALSEPPGGGVVTLALDGGDALPADDRAFAWIPASRPLTLTLASDDATLVARFRALERALPGTRVEAIAPDALRRGRPSGADVVVLDGFVPEVGTGPALVLAPPAGNALCPTGRRADAASVVDWDDAHPVLAGFGSLAALDVVGARRLARPAWATSVVEAAAIGGGFPLLVAGEREGVRIACMGLRPTSAAADDLPLLLLAFGAIRWLAEPPGGVPVAVSTGDAIVTDGGGVQIAERVGVQRLASDDGRVLLANLLAARESDIGRASSVERTAPRRDPPAPSRGGRTYLAWWLALAAAALLVAEWTLWGRR